MGGFHATWMPEEAGQHADSVVLGEAELSWARVLEDFKAGHLQKVYRADGRADLKGLPVPRRDLLKRKGYFFTNTMQVSRGCPFQCSFCSVTAFFGHTCRFRPWRRSGRKRRSSGGRMTSSFSWMTISSEVPPMHGISLLA